MREATEGKKARKGSIGKEYQRQKSCYSNTSGKGHLMMIANLRSEHDMSVPCPANLGLNYSSTDGLLNLRSWFGTTIPIGVILVKRVPESKAQGGHDTNDLQIFLGFKLLAQTKILLTDSIWCHHNNLRITIIIEQQIQSICNLMAILWSIFFSEWTEIC